MMDISAEKLKRARLQRNLSQELLAKQSGLSLRTIQRLESRGGGSAETLQALCATLDIAAQELQLSETPPVANWQLKGILSRVAVLLVLLSALISLMKLASASTIHIYIDTVSLLIITSYLILSFLICYGFDGLITAICGLKFLTSSAMYNRQASLELAKMYSFTYKSCYSAALVGSAIGLVSLLHSFAASANTHLLLTGLYVLSIVWLYAAIIAECVLRPLIYKLKNAKD